MQRGEHQVTGFSRRQGQADRLQIAHLAYQDHVRVFTQSGPQGVGERLCR